MSAELYELIDELRATANRGLAWSGNDHDRQRYEKVLVAAARLMSLAERRSLESVQREFEDNTLYRGPMMGAGAAVFNAGEILLIKRHDNGLWAIPGGAVETGETLAEAAERELREETGVEGKAARLLGVFDSRVWKSEVKRQMYHAVFWVECEAPEPKATEEATEVGFFGETDLPPLAPGHHVRVPKIFELARTRDTFFDA